VETAAFGGHMRYWATVFEEIDKKEKLAGQEIKKANLQPA
jgi:hypothetical protein